MNREDAIALATAAALEEYESDLEYVRLIDASFEDGEWVVVLEIWGWLTSEWRVWEYEGEAYWELIAG